MLQIVDFDNLLFELRNRRCNRANAHFACERRNAHYVENHGGPNLLGQPHSDRSQGGLIVLLIGGGLGFAGTTWIMNRHDVVGVHATSTTWLAAVMGIIGVIALVGGGVAQLVAWIGALINTAQLADKTWFVVLLLPRAP